MRDLDDVPQEVRDAFTFHSVGSMDEVLALGLRTPSVAHAIVTPTSGSSHGAAQPTVPARRERGGRRAPVHPH